MDITFNIHKITRPLRHSGNVARLLSTLIVILLCCISICNAIHIDKSSREIPIDFPFFLNSEGMPEYTLVLATPFMADADYELRLRDSEGVLLQRISCGFLQEPVTFFYDGLKYAYHTGLEIFSAGSQTGLFFTWDNEKLFSQKAVEIPRYEEVRNPWFVGSVEDGSLLVKTIYQVNEAKERTERLRCWRMDRSNGALQIWDYLEDQAVFEGKVALDGDGNPVNQAYYDYLFWESIPLILDYSPNPTIATWVMRSESVSREPSPASEESSFERIQGQLFGNTGETTEYESRQALLTDFGFWNKEPMYRYFDRYGNLQLEFYLDENTQKGCGIAYQYRFMDNLEKITSLQGFTIDGIAELEAYEKDPFAIKSVYGTDGAETADYTEHFVYAEDGRLLQYSSEDSIDWLRDADDYYKEKILSLDFIYRDDGTLFCRKYWHNSYIFGSTYTGMRSYYDEMERLVYENAYITHGSLEYYYIYEKDDTQPSYFLFLDYNMEYAIPELVRYIY